MEGGDSFKILEEILEEILSRDNETVLHDCKHTYSNFQGDGCKVLGANVR